MRKIVLLLALSLYAFVPQTFAQEDEFRINAQIRFRPEFHNNKNFIKSNNTAYVGQRVRIGIGGDLDEEITFLIQAQDTRKWGEKANNVQSGTEQEALDLYQAWFQINNAFDIPLDIKIGRQMLVYGDQRLLGHLAWTDNARAFDAFKFVFKIGKSHIDLFAAKLEESGKPSGSDSDQDLYGAYTVWKLPANNNLDVYYLNWRSTGGRNVNTYGLRLAGKYHVGLDYSLEGAFQGGDWSTTDSHQANAYAVKLGFTFKKAWATRIGVEYDAGSGDDDTSDTTHKTFVFPFHTNHAHYGFMDYFSWGNMKDLSLHLKTKPGGGKTLVKIAYHMLTLADKNDTWYNVVGTTNLFGAGDTGLRTSDDAGQEIDLTVVRPYNKRLKMVGGLSMFMPGAAAKERSGDDETASWGYLMLILNI